MIFNTSAQATNRYAERVRLIHLSDIHFQKGVSETSLDPNRGLLAETILDVESMCSETKADAVLVGGDVAFAGGPLEYEIAARWLTKIIERSGRPSSQVLVVPGNHDVDRALADSPVCSAIHKTIKSAELAKLRSTLSHHLRDEESARILSRPTDHYNLFASKYLCDLKYPDRTTARIDLILNDGSTLALIGLNSACLSSTNDKESELVLDEACFNFVREPGTEYLTLSHHPPRWLREGNALDTQLNSLVRIQLFGHEHDQRVVPGRDNIRAFAGAICPERDKGGWKPGYNIIDIRVDSAGASRQMVVRITARAWQGSPARFYSVLDLDDSPYFEVKIPLRAWTPPAARVQDGSAVSEAKELVMNGTLDDKKYEKEVAMPTELRTLFLRFLGLSLSKRSAIAGKLELLADSDTYLPDNERFRLVLKRAVSEQKIEALEHELNLVDSTNS